MTRWTASAVLSVVRLQIRRLCTCLMPSTFLGVEGIKQVHNLRIWSLTTDKTALAAHLVIDHGLSAQTVLTEATQRIRAKYDLYEMTLQVEEFQPDMVDCGQCQDPVK